MKVLTGLLLGVLVGSAASESTEGKYTAHIYVHIYIRAITVGTQGKQTTVFTVTQVF